MSRRRPHYYRGGKDRRNQEERDFDSKVRAYIDQGRCLLDLELPHIIHEDCPLGSRERSAERLRWIARWVGKAPPEIAPYWDRPATTSDQGATQGVIADRNSNSGQEGNQSVADKRQENRTTVAPRPNLTCPCGSPIGPSGPVEQPLNGRPRLYCSKKCSKRAEHARARQRRTNEATTTSAASAA
jgi:hypothetical protein